MRVRACKNFTSNRGGTRSKGEVFTLDPLSAEKLIAVGAVEPMDGTYETKVVREQPTTQPVADTPAEPEQEVPASVPLDSGEDAHVSSPPADPALPRRTRRRSRGGETGETTNEES
jgi:hypothetical protein